MCKGYFVLQYWMLSKAGEVRRDEACLDYAGQEVILYPCHGSRGNQYWQYKPDVSLNHNTDIGNKLRFHDIAV